MFTKPYSLGIASFSLQSDWQHNAAICANAEVQSFPANIFLFKSTMETLEKGVEYVNNKNSQ